MSMSRTPTQSQHSGLHDYKAVIWRELVRKIKENVYLRDVLTTNHSYK